MKTSVCIILINVVTNQLENKCTEYYRYTGWADIGTVSLMDQLTDNARVKIDETQGNHCYN